MPESAPITRTEPVLSAETIRLVLAGVVALGWASWDNTTAMALATAGAALVSVGMSMWARARVTPLARRWLGERPTS